MMNLFKKKKENKKMASAADFKNSNLGMVVRVLPFLPLALLILGAILQNM